MRIVSASLIWRRRFLGPRSATFRFQLFLAVNVVKDTNLLPDAVLVNFYFLRPQICDWVMVLIADHQIQ